jgi:hypothetical protein
MLMMKFLTAFVPLTSVLHRRKSKWFSDVALRDLTPCPDATDVQGHLGICR